MQLVESSLEANTAEVNKRPTKITLSTHDQKRDPKAKVLSQMYERPVKIMICTDDERAFPKNEGVDKHIGSSFKMTISTRDDSCTHKAMIDAKAKECPLNAIATARALGIPIKSVVSPVAKSITPGSDGAIHAKLRSVKDIAAALQLRPVKLVRPRREPQLSRKWFSFMIITLYLVFHLVNVYLAKEYYEKQQEKLPNDLRMESYGLMINHLATMGIYGAITFVILGIFLFG